MTAAAEPLRAADRAERLLARWIALWLPRRGMFLAILVLLGVVFSWFSRGIAWEPDVLAFFSAESADVRDMHAAASGAGLATQLRLDVHWRGGAGPDDELRAAAKQFAGLLRGTGEFAEVWEGVDDAQIAARYQGLLAQAPALLDDAQRKTIEARATPDLLEKRFAEVRAHLADPDGEILLRRLAADPLDISDLLAAKLRGLGDTSADLSGGMLMAHDGAGGAHVMLVASPRSPPSDQAAAEALMRRLAGAQRTLAAEYPTVETWAVGAHPAYVENAARVRRDVGMVSAVGSLAVGLAIFFFFARRAGGLRHGLSAVLVCMLPPGVGIGVALGLAGLFHARLPLILLGFAGLLCGSTTDYGIQIICELRRLAAEETWRPGLPARAARRMLGPISMSVGTSVAGFAALGLSAAPGLRALGLFVAGATVCIWLVTFFVLPVFLGAPGVESLPRTAGVSRRILPRLLGTAAFLGATLLLTYHALHVRFNTDPQALSGTSTALQEQEAAFYRVWGDLRNRAVVEVHGRDAAEALERLESVDAYLDDMQRDGLIAGKVSPAGLLPPQEQAEARLAAWRAIWTPERRARLAADLRTAAVSAGMNADAFARYAERMAAPAVASAESRLADSPAALLPGFIAPGRDTVTLVVQMRGDVTLRRATGWIPELRLRFADLPGAVTIISGNALVFDAMDRARAEGERLAPLCLLAILLPLWIYFRSLRRAWLVLLCLVAGLLWVLGAAQFFGHGLNLLSLVPVLFTLGVAVDYGIYRATAAPPAQDSRGSATFLCALTTLLGSGSLILATHPAMRWLGITLVAGIAGGYLTSVFIVAPIAARPRARLRAGRRIAGYATVAGLFLLTLVLAAPVLAEAWMAREDALPLPATPLPQAAPTLVRPAPRSYVYGKSSMRWHDAGGDMGLWEMRLVGDATERGMAASRLGGPIDVRIETEMLDQLDTFLPEEWSRWLVLRGVGVSTLDLGRYISPEDRDEIRAMAVAHQDPRSYLAPTYPRLLSYHALHDISQMLIDNPLIAQNAFGCTGVVSLPAYSSDQPGGHLLLGRVFDFEGGESFSRQKSITYVIPAEGIPFAHVAWPGLSGAVTGMNRERLAVFINAAATGDYRRIGTPTILLARDILQHARTIEEAERTIRAAQVFVSDILVVADGKSGRVRVFEKSPARCDAYDVEASAVVTNHLVTPTFALDPVNQQRLRESTTGPRYARARQLLDGLAHQVTPAALAALLRDKRGVDNLPLGYGNRNAIDGLIACHGVIMDVTAGRMWVSTWPYVEGPFVQVDVLAMLDRAGEAPPASSLENIPLDKMLLPEAPGGSSPWQRWQASLQALERGQAALAAGQAEQAADLAEQAIRENPDFYLGHELLGRARLAQGRYADARQQFFEALAHDPPYLQRREAIKGLIQQCGMHLR